MRGGEGGGAQGEAGEAAVLDTDELTRAHLGSQDPPH